MVSRAAAMWQPYRTRAVWLVFSLLFVSKLLVGGVLSTIPERVSFPEQSVLENLTPQEPQPFFWTFNRWEGSNLEILARDWYTAGPDLVVKFPLYPGIIRGLWLFSQQTIPLEIIMFGVHTLCVLFATGECYRYIQEIMPEQANRALMWQGVPFVLAGYIWFYHYDDALFVGLVWLFLTVLHRSRYGAAGLAGMLLVLARPTGIVLPGLVLVLTTSDIIQAMRQSGKAPDHLAQRLILAGWFPMLIWLAWVTYISYVVNVSFAPYSVQAVWGREDFILSWVWRIFTDLQTNGIQVYHLMLLYLIPVQLLALCFMAVRSLQQEHLRLPVIYTGVVILVPFLSYFAGWNRFAMPTLIGLMPVFIDSVRLRHLEPVLWAGLWLVNVALALIIATDVNFSQAVWLP